MDMLSDVPGRVREAILAARTDGERVDQLGFVTSLMANLADQKKMAQSEIPATTDEPVRGAHWEMTRGNRAKRTYSARLLYTMDTMGEGLDITIRKLVDAKVLSLTWSWTQLQRYAAMVGAKLIIKQGEEIDPDDAEFDVGQKWGEDSPRYTWIGDDDGES